MDFEARFGRVFRATFFGATLAVSFAGIWRFVGEGYPTIGMVACLAWLCVFIFCYQAWEDACRAGDQKRQDQREEGQRSLEAAEDRAAAAALAREKIEDDRDLAELSADYDDDPTLRN